ncbi:hypothetical protein CRM22_003521 [Opisthorchis felineus]|uniref:Tetraspanin n=1 Tax=Opisthorchis felineus TaxID=147828 RepID=A0A4S2M0T6_OPIFE|nr:hypothetical protein CRM22_003521 [Opisthorchis felineus]
MCRVFTSILLAILNVVILLAGIVLIVLGGVILWSRDVVERAILSTFKGAAETPGQADAMATEATMLFKAISGPIGIASIVIGVIFFVIAIFSFVGVCCHVKAMLIIYACIVGTIALIHFILIIIHFSNEDLYLRRVDKKIHDLAKNYKSIESGELFSVTFGMIMTMFDCCGYNNGTDFLVEGAQFTHRDSYRRFTFPSIQYPVPCCKKGHIGEGAQDCPQVFSEVNSNYLKGCNEGLHDSFKKPVMLVALSSLVIPIVALVAFILTIILLCYASKDDSYTNRQPVIYTDASPHPYKLPYTVELKGLTRF